MTRTIKATVSQGILKRATRLFDASTTDILNELFQNARRAGATDLHLYPHEINGEQYIALVDNGKGIDDPATLLNLGHSEWENKTQVSEDPAGMGFFSLASRGAYVWSNDWGMQLKPEHFTGVEEAIVESVDQPISGTQIAFKLENNETLEYFEKDHLAKAARYYPLPVYWQGKRVGQVDFLQDKGCIYYEYLKGLKIGVKVSSSYYANNQGNLNFHGITLGLPELAVKNGEHTYYHCCVDVVDCPDLKLVLPARKEIVQNKFIKQLQRACYIVIYRYISEHVPDHKLSFEHYQNAHRLGVNLPPAAQKLPKYVPRNAKGEGYDNESYYSWREESYASVDDPQSVWVFDDEDLTISQRIAVYEGFSKLGKTLVEPNLQFQGYEWYNQLLQSRSIEFVDVIAGIEGKEVDTEELTEEIDADYLRVRVQQSSEILTADLKMYSYVDEDDCTGIWDIFLIHLAKSAIPDLSVWELQSYLKELLYSPSDEGDSYETQESDFDEEAAVVASKRLLTEEAYRDQLIKEHLSKLSHFVPDGKVMAVEVFNDASKNIYTIK